MDDRSERHPRPESRAIEAHLTALTARYCFPFPRYLCPDSAAPVPTRVTRNCRSHTPFRPTAIHGAIVPVLPPTPRRGRARQGPAIATESLPQRPDVRR